MLWLCFSALTHIFIKAWEIYFAFFKGDEKVIKTEVIKLNNQR